MAQNSETPAMSLNTALNTAFEKATEEIFGKKDQSSGADDKANEGDAEGTTSEESEESQGTEQSEDTADSGSDSESTAGNTDEDEILTQDEVNSLSEKERAAYKKMQKAHTQRSQRLAEERRKFEADAKGLGNWNNFVVAYQKDPKGAVKWLAQQSGISIAEAAAVAEQKVEEKAEAVKSITEEMKEALGPDLAYLGDVLGPLIEKFVSSKAQETIKPLTDFQTQAKKDAAKTNAEATLDAFSAKLSKQNLPDWTEYEEKMSQLMDKFPCGKDTDPIEYLEGIYHMAARSAVENNTAKRMVDKMKRSVAEGEKRTVGVGQEKVKPGLSKAALEQARKGNLNAAFEEAFDAAKQGISFGN